MPKGRGTRVLIIMGVFCSVLAAAESTSWGQMFWKEDNFFQSDEASSYSYFGNTIVESDGVLVVTGSFSPTGSPADQCAALYIYYRNTEGTDWVFVKKLHADCNNPNGYGSSIDLDGSILVVGVHGDDTAGENAGAVYIYYRDQGGVNNWGLVKVLTNPDETYTTGFGRTVTLSGTTLAVSNVYTNSYGLVYVFEKDVGGQDNWGLVKQLERSEQEDRDSFGLDMNMSGDYLAVGAHEHGYYEGAVYIFKRNQGGANNWGEVKRIVPSNLTDRYWFGYELSINNGILAVKCLDRRNVNNIIGSVCIFLKDQGGADNWGEVDMVYCPEVDPNSENCDVFGRTIELEDGILAVSDEFNSDYFMRNGALYIFRKQDQAGSAWQYERKLHVSNPGEYEYFPRAIAISGNTIFAGDPAKPSPEDNPNRYAGYVYVYRYAYGQGDQCAQASECHTGFCADGVCCNSFCGGGDPTDCQACSKAAGSTEDGLCFYIPGGSPCDDGLFCTIDDQCNGMNVCEGVPRNCSANGGCMVGTCDENNDTCVQNPADDGAPCDDDDECTEYDRCVGGQCVGNTRDRDYDGYADAACGGDDCDDSNAAIHPGAEDAPCDGVDADCSGNAADDPDPSDSDGDGYTVGCGQDCDDDDPHVYPGANEICEDGVDQDCNGEDLSCGCGDDDEDGYIDASCGGDDCDDHNNTVHPGAPENCFDGLDNDCDGLVDAYDTEVCKIEPPQSDGGGCGCSTGHGRTAPTLLLLFCLFLATRKRRV